MEESESITFHVPVIEVEQDVSKNCLPKTIIRKPIKNIVAPSINYGFTGHLVKSRDLSLVFYPLVPAYIISSYTKSGARIFQEISSHS